MHGIILIEQEESAHNCCYELELKLESHSGESSNMSTQGSFSQNCSEFYSPATENKEAGAEQELQCSAEDNQEIFLWTQKVSHILQEIIKVQQILDKNKLRSFQNSCFNNSCIPQVSLSDYMYKIMTEARLEIDICIISLFYIDRLTSCQPNFRINQFNCHRLILTSMMVASKMHQDIQSYFQVVKLFSLIGGVCEKELYLMEQTLLDLLNYQLFISEDDYTRYKNQLTCFQL
ncbi:amine-terminal domain cyclin (macronuclear) [Tetrahymena thermophila SB210]|uniref:Amine-terminal domain cyclin n=1 Tax=Tetrahymena thermophila (strain SB210) TaxID=312017 RepID=Q23D49_TETTS|nr:amine-terminal domain cyclin [Tetrahymena thermophila SB210]EAR94600.2 amine-terminal domain cyclin [Tetrahymena thermophila SB210]|eukprot:XP_001014837.2 amine-terminal domain cyclin [Tetrahymena thermophila SB210]